MILENLPFRWHQNSPFLILTNWKYRTTDQTNFLTNIDWFLRRLTKQFNLSNLALLKSRLIMNFSKLVPSDLSNNVKNIPRSKQIKKSKNKQKIYVTDPLRAEVASAAAIRPQCRLPSSSLQIRALYRLTRLLKPSMKTLSQHQHRLYPRRPPSCPTRPALTQK